MPNYSILDAQLLAVGTEYFVVSLLFSFDVFFFQVTS